MRFTDLDLSAYILFKNNIDNCSFLSIFGSEYSFAVMYALRKYEKLSYAIFEGSILIKGERAGKIFFYPPVSDTERKFISAVEKCIELSGKDFSMLCLTEEMRNLLQYNTNLKFTADRDMYEYLYLPESLITYGGKKLHAKRNYVNWFNANLSYEFRPYLPSDLFEIEGLIEKWEETKYNYSAYEKDAIISSLQNIEKISIICDVLLIGGKICGFIIASTDKNLDVNIIFEKADISYKGIYAVLMNCFIKKNFSLHRYINMQEDMGIEGLKKSKLSYFPVKFIEKYNAELL